MLKNCSKIEKNTMILIIVNYIVKILTILIGVFLLAGNLIFPQMPKEPMLKIMGVVLILWGSYRLIIYRIQLKRYNNEEDSDD